MSIDAARENFDVDVFMEGSAHVERELVPQLDTLHDMAMEAYKRKKEYGCQLIQKQADSAIVFHSTYVIGQSNSIREPEVNSNDADGVFFHTHWSEKRELFDRLLGKKHTSWYMLPSDVGVSGFERAAADGTGVDTIAQFQRSLGGYFNIVTPGHMTFNIWKEPDEANADLTDSTWEIVIGREKGRVFTPYQLLSDQKSTPDDLMVWKHRWPKGKTNYFLVVGGTSIYDFESDMGSVVGLCFGDGLDVLMDRFGVSSTPHARNLSEITKQW